MSISIILTLQQGERRCAEDYIHCNITNGNSEIRTHETILNRSIALAKLLLKPSGLFPDPRCVCPSALLHISRKMLELSRIGRENLKGSGGILTHETFI